MCNSLPSSIIVMYKLRHILVPLAAIICLCKGYSFFNFELNICVKIHILVDVYSTFITALAHNLAVRALTMQLT